MFRSSLPRNGCSIDTTICVINRCMAKIQNYSGGYQTLLPEVVEVAPLYEVNSTAYAVKVEYNFNDTLHPTVVLLERTDGDPIPSNMEELKAKVINAGDIDPHHSMHWIVKLVEDPDYRNPIRIDDNVRPLEI